MNNTYIKGKFKRTIFEKNGFIIGLFKIEETDENNKEYLNKTITFKGYAIDFNEVDNYKLYGKFENNIKYGKEFIMESFERIKPEDKDSIIIFLSSGIFKGIGEAKAKLVVEHLGKKTLDIILEHPEELYKIKGLSKNNIKVLTETLMEYETSYKTILKLEDLGFNVKEASLIYSLYKNKSLDIIENNIYEILDNNKFIFKRIDYIALNHNIEKDNINRLSAAIIYIINTLSNTYGHTYYYKEDILMYMPKVLNININEDMLDNALSNLINKNKIVIYEDKIYEKNMFEAETYIVKRLNVLQHEKETTYKNIDKELLYVESYLGVSYDKTQEEAIKKSITNSIEVITGGPGTGKTTIEKGILELYKTLNKLEYNKLEEAVALLSPTGRASKRMTEACNFKAQTIHRFLKWNKDTNSFQINEYNKSKVKLLIIDEASMIDVLLFYNLLKGVSVNCKIILVGDSNQLPSVGAGNLLGDIIESNKINICKLEKLYRQKEGSNIITLANDIKDGILNKNIFNVDESLKLIECSDIDLLDEVGKIAKNYKENNYKDFQVLAPMYKGINGIDNINNKLQEIFNNKVTKSININNEIYKINDKVIELNNMPDENIFNGDIGIISNIEVKPNKEVYILFDDYNEAKFSLNAFNNFKKAYCISIHKSQGSEFNTVIIPVVKGYSRMLYRKLIYTAVTRCKKKLYIVGNINALKDAIDNNITDIRRTSIKDFLIKGIN